jgi:hypothetical protein
MKKHKTKNRYDYASRFWLGSDFDTDFKRKDGVDYTKLAAAQRAIGNFVNIVTGKQIPVIFQSNDQSYTNGERVVIGTKLDSKEFDPAVGLALHEGSHIAFTDFEMFKPQNGGYAHHISNTKMANIVRMNGYDPDMSMTERDFFRIKDLLNWIEDRRIDYIIYTTAPGYRMYYESMYNKFFNDKVIDKALRSNAKTSETWDDYMFHIINFTNPNRRLNALAHLRDIWNVIDLKNINRLQNTADALLLSCQVWKIIETATKQEKQDELDEVRTAFEQGGMMDPTPNDFEDGDGASSSINANVQSDSIESDEETDDESDEDADGEDSKDDSEVPSMGDADMDDEDDDLIELTQKELDQLQKAIDAQKKFVAGNTKKSGRLTKTQSRLVKAIRESGTETRQVYTDQSGTMSPIETVVIKKLTTAIIDSMPELFESYASEYLTGQRKLTDSNSYTGRRIRENETAVQRGLVLGRQLGNRLQLRNADKSLKSTRLQSGKIDRRLISQLGYDNANVFHRIVTDRFKNYFIHISIDASGSMSSGEKFQNAITSAVAIAQAASMTTGIRVQISIRGTERLGGDAERCVTMYAYDSAKDKMNKIKTYFKYLSTFGCTPEGLAFKSIEPDLIKDAKGDECIFINYSDGEPTDVVGVARSYNGVDFTKRVIMNMRSNNINVISYFISYGGVYASTRTNFCTMYGQDASFIDPKNVLQIAKTMNKKFLEIAS